MLSLPSLRSLSISSGSDDVPLLERPAMEFTRHDAGDVVKKHPADRFLYRYFCHHDLVPLLFCLLFQ